MKSNSPLREDKVSDFLGINMSKRTDGSILDNLLTLNIESAASAPAPSPEVAWAPEAALSPLLSWMNKGGISSVSIDLVHGRISTYWEALGWNDVSWNGYITPSISEDMASDDAASRSVSSYRRSNPDFSAISA